VHPLTLGLVRLHGVPKSRCVHRCARRSAISVLFPYTRRMQTFIAIAAGLLIRPRSTPRL